MKKRKEVYTINGFLNKGKPIRIENNGGEEFLKSVATSATLAASVSLFSHIVIPSLMITSFAATATPVIAHSSVGAGVSAIFDHKIWPIFIDIGKPVTKTMMALGIYKVMRGNEKGWKEVERAGLGLVCLYLIDGAIHILSGLGEEMQTV